MTGIALLECIGYRACVHLSFARRLTDNNVDDATRQSVLSLVDCFVTAIQLNQ